jgi:Fuc2NAc and GlcNAc transferase
LSVYIFIVVIGGFLCSWLLTLWVRRVATTRGLLDVPNARSSHQVPTPRGGGLAIVVTSLVGFSLLGLLHLLDARLAAALVGGGIVVAIVGFIDDHRPLPAGLRLGMHVAAAVWAVAWLGGLPPLRIGEQVVTLGTVGFVLCVLEVGWTLNLFNFMDGIDGIAASEAVFIAGAGALLAFVSGHATSLIGADLLLAAATAGFLCFNWPPARIFMGDIGSGYLGYVIAVLATAATRQDPAAAWQWLILGGVFFVDATVTLLRRLARRERAQDAHRSHAYQWLSRRWKSHLRVTLATMVLNVLWLLPCALLATVYPRAALWMLLLALGPVTVLAVLAGAGRSEA